MKANAVGKEVKGKIFGAPSVCLIYTPLSIPKDKLPRHTTFMCI